VTWIGTVIGQKYDWISGQLTRSRASVLMFQNFLFSLCSYYVFSIKLLITGYFKNNCFLTLISDFSLLLAFYFPFNPLKSAFNPFYPFFPVFCFFVIIRYIFIS